MNKDINRFKVLFLLLIVLAFLPASSLANEIPKIQIALEEFDFNQLTTFDAGDGLLAKYFESEYYRQFNYDRANPVMGSFIATDCSRNPIRLVFLTYTSLISDRMIWTVFRLTETGVLQLEGEGVGLAKNVSELVYAFKHPYEHGMCHTDKNE